jgi:hypothetical protein
VWLPAYESEEHTFGMSESPDTGHFEEDDEHSQTEIDIAGGLGGEDGGGNAALTERENKHAFAFHNEIGNGLMKCRDQKAEKKPYEFRCHGGHANHRSGMAQSEESPSPAVTKG